MNSFKSIKVLKSSAKSFIEKLYHICFNLELGGEIWVGKIDETTDYSTVDDAHVFKFQGYFGLNPVNPLQNYVYFRQSGKDLTVENFCAAFDIALPAGTPKPLRESGFIGEQIFSYTNNPAGEFSLITPPL